MQPLIDLLRDNVILVFLFGAWILSAVSGVIARAVRKAEQQRRAAQQRPLPTQRPAQRPTQPPTQRAAQRPTRPADMRPTPRAGPTAEEIAAEIRRVMGMEEAPRPAPARQPQPSAPKPAPVPEEPASHFEHFAEDVGGLRSQVDPHVGQGVSARHAPMSGAVGSSRLGSLGGGLTPQVKRRVERRVRRFDLSDPAAVLVTLEILGKPRALRDFEF